MTLICSLRKWQYVVHTHICSMRLADTLKVLLRSNVLTKTVVASQGKNDNTEVSVNILNRNSYGNFFHRWWIVSAFIISFNQMHSHQWTDDNIRRSAFGRVIIVRSVFTVGAGALMIAQCFIRMIINTWEGVVLGKHTWKISYNLLVYIFIPCVHCFSREPKGSFPRRRTAQATLQFIPGIGRVTFGPRDDSSTLGFQVSAPDRFDNASFWMPSYTHWTIPNPTRKFNTVLILIVKVPLGQLPSQA